jgi:hypothetical protein
LVHLNHSVVSILNDRGVTKADYRPFYNELQYSQPINMAEVYNNKYLLNLDAKLDYWNVLLSLRNAEDSLLVRPIAMRWEKVGSNQEYGLCYYNHHTGEITWKPFSQIQGVSPLTRAMHRAPIKDITSFAE